MTSPFENTKLKANQIRLLSQNRDVFPFEQETRKYRRDKSGFIL